MTKMGKEDTKSEAEKSADETGGNLPTTLVSKGGQKQEISQSHESHKDTPTGDPSEESDKTIWRRVKVFMKREDATQWIMVFLTLAIVLFTSVTSFFTCRQIRIYEKATHADLRAYLFCASNEYGTSYFSNTDKVRIRFRNYGHTPALKPRVQSESRAFAGEFPDSPPYSSNADTVPDVPVIGERETVTDIYPFKDLTDTTLQSLVSGKAVMYLYGTVRYEDIFHERYCLHFCYRLDPTNGATKFFAYGKYNREEKECDEKD